MKLSKYIYEQTLKLILQPLPYKVTDLEPVMSAETIDYHYSNLAAGYVKRFNKGEGDPDFNKAGTFLHNIYFAQFKKPEQSNAPTGLSKQMITDHFGSFPSFQKEVEQVAMKIQGSGWVYLADDGEIKTIRNHEIKKDIILLIDWWEHAWALDYQSDKAKYLANIWSIIDWDVISSRIAVKP